ncbi:DnaJ family molecular chaperone [Pseudomonas aeruginosa]|nr:DnaJ family molecular chaperone [Pseudomonas aeruginosa]
MLWPATLIGAGAGWALASIPGALLGGLLGQLLDRRLRLESWRGLLARLRGRAVNDEDDLLLQLLGYLAKSGGRVEEMHIRQAREEMALRKLDRRAQRRAIASFGKGKAGIAHLQAEVARLKGERAEAVLLACWRMAWAGGGLSQAARQLVLQWGRWLGWSAERTERLSARVMPKRTRAVARDSYREALLLLGVEAGSEPALIKRAYRKLISQHHPDKLAGAGASVERVRAATEKTRELQAAYALVREREGFR